MALRGQIYEIANSYVETLSRDIESYGHFRALLLHTLLPNVRSVLAGIQKNVVAPELKNKTDDASEAAMMIRNSSTGTLTMIGVAGAIFAQAALSTLYLRDISVINWTAQAAILISALSGALSVYFACLAQVKINGLLKRAEIKEWLMAPRVYLKLASDETSAENVYQAHLGKMPSFSSAVRLAMPSELLNWSVGSLIVGEFIYISLIYANQPSGSLDRNASLPFLLIYVIYMTAILLLNMLPTFGKMLESTCSARDAREASINELTGILQERGIEAFSRTPFLPRSRSSSPVSATRNTLRSFTVESKANETPKSQDKVRDSLQSLITTNASGLQNLDSRNLHTEALIAALRDSISARKASIQTEEELLRCFGGS